MVHRDDYTLPHRSQMLVRHIVNFWSSDDGVVAGNTQHLANGQTSQCMVTWSKSNTAVICKPPDPQKATITHTVAFWTSYEACEIQKQQALGSKDIFSISHSGVVSSRHNTFAT